MTSPVNADVRLGIDEFSVDKDSPHIILKTDPDRQALEIPIKTYPAGLCKKQDDDSVRFDYVEYLECGAYRIPGLDTALEGQEYPRGTFGMEFHCG